MSVRTRHHEAHRNKLALRTARRTGRRLVSLFHGPAPKQHFSAGRAEEPFRETYVGNPLRLWSRLEACDAQFALQARRAQNLAAASPIGRVGRDEGCGEDVVDRADSKWGQGLGLTNGALDHLPAPKTSISHCRSTFRIECSVSHPCPKAPKSFNRERCCLPC